MSELHYFSSNDIKDMARFYRANLINSITGYKPANLIGTYSETGVANLALFSSVVHLGADPALIGYIQRPVLDYGHTYKNIIKNGSYTINHVHESFIDNAHFTSAKFKESESEFKLCGLTEENLVNFNAPFVKESRIKIGLEFIQEIPIELNNTKLIIGKIEHIFIDEKTVLPDGSVDLSAVHDVATSGLHTYNKVSRIKSLPYAKATEKPQF